MATRSSGVSGAIYGLIIFVFLFVIALALAIMFYAQRARTQEELTTTSQQLEMFQKGEENNPALPAIRDAAEKQNRSIFAEMNNRIDTLKRWLDGAEKPLSEIEADLQAANVTGGANALGKIQELQGQISANEKQIADLKTSLERRSDEVDSLKAQFTKAQSGIAEERTALSNQLENRTSQFTKTTSDYEAQHKEMVAQMQKISADARQQVQQMQDKVNDMQAEIDRLNGRIRALVQTIEKNRLTGPDLTLEADGQIVDVIPQENMVYINLGKDDHLILGMTFEVFDEGTGIRTEVERNGQTVQVGGKAKIEVVRFGESGKTAACRIIYQAYGKPIVAGDLISNIVYDRNRVFRFFVFGDFDLNNDGQSTAADRERVTSLITKWGGKVITADEMPVDTDFLVLGIEPTLPKALPDNPPPTPEQMEEHLAAMKKYKQYYELAGQARELSIPILNQNRFLTLIGYYGR